jgi:hypothetical protein
VLRFDEESRIIRDCFVCTDCHKTLDADVNAARNILAFGTSATGGHPGMACESSQTTGRKQEEDAREGRSSSLVGTQECFNIRPSISKSGRRVGDQVAGVGWLASEPIGARENCRLFVGYDARRAHVATLNGGPSIRTLADDIGGTVANIAR